MQKMRFPSLLSARMGSAIMDGEGRVGGNPSKQDYRPLPNFGWNVTPNVSRMLFCVWLPKRVMR